ncbi:substrate-binding domain-containing protein [Homoserinibacter sp. YIM 151385]|uniref:substrate-binding domain-containing protein n=1 Tax=Homoserinibacter sp. YIM 151385 TaxID=2985506 RepID=UPI0022F08DAF|nr:substrate-binding domain-containing protein [Homoserinibacter sp. YIM 151385]WBU39253.1 substrate-binding domain-containing protein [Homoserinibacter sp. YIM 151385]
MAIDVQKLHRTLAVPALAAGALVVLAGCATPAGGGSGDGAVKVGITVSNSTNPFFVAESRTAEETAKAAGAEVISQEAGEDVQTQSNQIDQFITSGVSFIVIDPVDSDGVGPAVKRAIDAGIPVIGIDSVTKNATVSITTNNTQAGEVSCVSLAEQLGGEGKIAILDGTPISAVADRVTGCKAALEDYPGIEIVAEQRGDNSRDKALPVATDILTANPDIDGVFAINDPTAAGVQLAAEQKGLDIIITSVDGAKSAVDVILAGGMITATAAQDPAALAKQGVETGLAILDGTDPESDLIELPTELIDADSAPDYTPWG